MTMDWEEAKELFRNDVLDALDNAACKVLKLSAEQGDHGAADADLPELFKAIDAQFETVMKRYGREEPK